MVRIAHILFLAVFFCFFSAKNSQAAGRVDITTQTLRNSLNQLKVNGMEAIKVLAEATKASTPTSRAYVRDDFIIPFTAYLMGLGQLHPRGNEGTLLDRLYKENHPNDPGLKKIPELIDSPLREEMVVCLKDFVESAKSYSAEFYDIIYSFYKDPHVTKKEKRHLLALINYIHGIWAVQNMSDDGVLRLPQIKELSHFERFIGAENIKKALGLENVKNIHYYEEKTPYGNYPVAKSFKGIEEILDHLKIDYTRTLICSDFDDTLARKGDVRNAKGERISVAILPKERNQIFENLAQKGAVFALLTARKFEEESDVEAIAQPLNDLNLVTLNQTTENSLKDAFTKRAEEQLSNETFYVNNGNLPILFADMQGTKVGINNKGTVVLDFMRHNAHAPSPFTIVMIDDDLMVLKNMHRTLEGSGYTFIGIQIMHPEEKPNIPPELLDFSD